MASNQPILSIIIPVYNVEDYIGECLNSVYNQDICDTQFEVICVDDCSTDDSVHIIAVFQALHDNLLLLHHSKNEKLGKTRNTGLSAAKGKYVWFVDSDDFIRENCFSVIVGQCEQNNLDIFHWTVMDNNGTILNPVIENGVMSGTDDVLKGNSPYWFAWDRVYRRDFLMDNNIWFSNERNGDILHTLSALNLAHRVMGSDTGYYYYRKERTDSAMLSLQFVASKVYDFSFVMGGELLRLSNELKPDLVSVALKHAVWQSNTAFRMAIKLPFREKVRFCKIIDSELKDDIWIILNAKNRILIQFPFILYLCHIPYILVHCVRHIKCRSVNNKK